ncbi:MAG: M28 family peptidase [Planctomycetes bacterium]|nr:M28 family peptidase [Planctomycetota bacterium]
MRYETPRNGESTGSIGRRLGALLALAVPLAGFPSALAQDAGAAKDATDPGLLARVRQLTFAGERAGEGYFSPDGTKLIFQSEREPGNPFFQIFLMDLATGESRRLSTGRGRSTCAWLHPSMRKALFSASHEDPRAKEKQDEEYRRRESSDAEREKWVYDEMYDIYEVDLASGERKNLTHTLGYDAEGSYSPDGTRILFSSNRHAYADGRTPEGDPALSLDLYIMDEDGSDVRRLTTADGQDGGPFFRADGRKIVWRRFSEDGLRAEIYTMDPDGTGETQLTHLGAMSWAPFFHPSGAYIIFTTNRHGFDNFELYLVDSEGRSAPVRATVRDGFDGLPVFSPDGTKLAWTSNRTVNRKGQLFIADWDHPRALHLLGLGSAPRAEAAPERRALPSGRGPLTAAIAAADLFLHTSRLASPALEGRLTGTPGERLATEYVAAVFREIGLEPAGADGTYYQPFAFTAGLSLGPGNALQLSVQDPAASGDLAADRDWRPLSFSATGEFGEAPIAFAGYGIVAPEGDGQPAYDAYAGLETRGKWVLLLRFLPEGIDQARRVRLAPYAGLRFKIMQARDRGAAGMIVASGPRSQVKRQLVPLAIEGTPAGSSIPAVSITDEVAARILAGTGKTLESIQEALDGGEPVPGFDIPGAKLAARIDVIRRKGEGRNVLARLRASDAPSESAIVIGAHVDHIGRGEGADSLAAEAERGEVHPGADDNASGVAATLEIAQLLADLARRREIRLRRDIIFAAWSGEELGLLGSGHFAQASRPEAGAPLYPAIAACLNMDMIGRLKDKLILYGAESSGVWPLLIERANAPIGMPVIVEEQGLLPTDAASFSTRGVPFLSAFTGVHADYHTPRDTADRIDYAGEEMIARLIARIARDVATAEAIPDAREPKRKPGAAMEGMGRRVYLGTIPDFAAGDGRGVKLSGATKGSPAESAGIREGDVVVELAGKKIDNLYDYAFAIRALKIGVPAEIVIERDGERLTLTVVPASRE